MKVDVCLLLWQWSGTNTERKPPGLRQPRRGGQPSRRTVVMIGKKADQILWTWKKWKKSNKESNTRNIPWKSQLWETCGPLAGLPWAQPCLLGLPSLPGHLSCACPPCHLPSTECERKEPVILLLRQRILQGKRCVTHLSSYSEHGIDEKMHTPGGVWTETCNKCSGTQWKPRPDTHPDSHPLHKRFT